MEFMLPKTAIQSRSFPRSSHHSTVQPPLNRRWDQFRHGRRVAVWCIQTRLNGDCAQLGLQGSCSGTATV